MMWEAKVKKEGEDTPEIPRAIEGNGPLLVNAGEWSKGGMGLLKVLCLRFCIVSVACVVRGDGWEATSG